MPAMIDYRDTSTPGNARAACIAGLVEGMRHAKLEVAIDDDGYVAQAEENLIPGLSLNDFADDLKGCAGQELMGKFRAAHSSAAAQTKPRGWEHKATNRATSLNSSRSLFSATINAEKRDG